MRGYRSFDKIKLKRRAARHVVEAAVPKTGCDPFSARPDGQLECAHTCMGWIWLTKSFEKHKHAETHLRFPMFPNVSRPSSRLARRFARCACSPSLLVGREAGEGAERGAGETEDADVEDVCGAGE